MKLCVTTGTIGLPSETFVFRHINDLYPHSTVVISRNRYEGEDGWKISNPTLVLSDYGRVRKLGGLEMILRTLGLLFPVFLLNRKQRKAVREFLKVHNSEVMLGEFLDATLPLRKIAQSLGIPLIAHGHGSDVSSRLRRLWWRFAYRAYRQNQVIVVSEFSKQRLVSKIGLSQSTVHVIPCGPDISKIKPNNPVESEQSNGSIRCLAVGRLVEKKDPLGLIETLFLANKESKIPIHLVIVGGGPLEAATREKIEALGLQDRCRMLGSVKHPEVIAEMQVADIFVQHSVTTVRTGEEEGLPVAILEAMATGLPIVSTRHAGIPEVIRENETGLLVDERDYLGMAKAILSLVDDSKLRYRLSLGARNLLVSSLSWQVEAANLRNLMVHVAKEERFK